jgi:DNA-binding NtrC family response regulator
VIDGTSLALVIGAMGRETIFKGNGRSCGDAQRDTVSSPHMDVATVGDLRHELEEKHARLEQLEKLIDILLGAFPDRVVGAKVEHLLRFRELTQECQRLRQGVQKQLPPDLVGGEASAPSNLAEASREFERRHIARVLHQVRGHRKSAAHLLGVSEATLYRKLDACGLKTRGGGPTHG